MDRDFRVTQQTMFFVQGRSFENRPDAEYYAGMLKLAAELMDEGASLPYIQEDHAIALATWILKHFERKA
jgi:hypothetical protein